jgi:hypothetical protein
MRPGIAPVSTALLLYQILVLLSLVCVNAQIGLPFPWQSNVRQISADFCSHLHIQIKELRADESSGWIAALATRVGKRP